MTLVPVDLSTGEIVSLLSHDEARDLTDQIRTSLADLRDLIVTAWRRGAWTALGYESWQDYCAAELSEVAIPKDERSTVVRALRSVGMSTRAIGAATGTSAMTASRETAGVPNVTPATVTGTDGKSYPSERPTAVTPYDPDDPATAWAECEILVGEAISAARVAIRAEMAVHLLSNQQIESLVSAVLKAAADLVAEIEKGYNRAN